MDSNGHHPDLRVEAGISPPPPPPTVITWRTLLLGALGSPMFVVVVLDFVIPRASRLLVAAVLLAAICLSFGGLFLAAKIRKSLKVADRE